MNLKKIFLLLCSIVLVFPSLQLSASVRRNCCAMLSHKGSCKVMQHSYGKMKCCSSSSKKTSKDHCKGEGCCTYCQCSIAKIIPFEHKTEPSETLFFSLKSKNNIEIAVGFTDVLLSIWRPPKIA